MLSSLSRIHSTKPNHLASGLPASNRDVPQIFEKIYKHLEVLHHRNSQLRNAILVKSEQYVSKRHSQFITVLRSYVRLIVVDLHGPIEKCMQANENSKYMKIRQETFAGYEKMVANSNLSSTEILKRGADFSRELFQMELQLKQYQEVEKEFVYPLFINKIH